MFLFGQNRDNIVIMNRILCGAGAHSPVILLVKDADL